MHLFLYYYVLHASLPLSQSCPTLIAMSVGQVGYWAKVYTKPTQTLIVDNFGDWGTDEPGWTSLLSLPGSNYGHTRLFTTSYRSY